MRKYLVIRLYEDLTVRVLGQNEVINYPHMKVYDTIEEAQKWAINGQYQIYVLETIHLATKQ